MKIVAHKEERVHGNEDDTRGHMDIEMQVFEVDEVVCDVNFALT